MKFRKNYQTGHINALRCARGNILNQGLIVLVCLSELDSVATLERVGKNKNTTNEFLFNLGWLQFEFEFIRIHISMAKAAILPGVVSGVPLVHVFFSCCQWSGLNNWPTLNEINQSCPFCFPRCLFKGLPLDSHLYGLFSRLRRDIMIVDSWINPAAMFASITVTPTISCSGLIFFHLPDMTNLPQLLGAPVESPDYSVQTQKICKLKYWTRTLKYVNQDQAHG